MTALLVMAGAAVGAPCRWYLDRSVQSRHETGFPWGTFVINVLGSLLLGLLLGLTRYREAVALIALLGTGFCGGFTTFGSFSFETMRLFDESRYARALGYVAGSVAVGLAAATVGWLAGGVVVA